MLWFAWHGPSPAFKGGSVAETGKTLEKVAVKAMKASMIQLAEAEHPIRFHPPKQTKLPGKSEPRKGGKGSERSGRQPEGGSRDLVRSRWANENQDIVLTWPCFKHINTKLGAWSPMHWGTYLKIPKPPCHGCWTGPLRTYPCQKKIEVWQRPFWTTVLGKGLGLEIKPQPFWLGFWQFQRGYLQGRNGRGAMWGAVAGIAPRAPVVPPRNRSVAAVPCTTKTAGSQRPCTTWDG